MVHEKKLKVSGLLCGKTSALVRPMASRADKAEDQPVKKPSAFMDSLSKPKLGLRSLAVGRFMLGPDTEGFRAGKHSSCRAAPQQL